MKKIIVASLISALLVVLAVGGAGYFFVHSGKLSQVVNPGAAPAPAPAVAPTSMTFVALPETIVTLNDNEGMQHYVLVGLALGVAEKEKEDTVKSDLPLYQSIIVSTLSHKSYDDAQAMKVPQIRDLLNDALKDELQKRQMKVPFCDVLVTKAVFQ